MYVTSLTLFLMACSMSLHALVAVASFSPAILSAPLLETNPSSNDCSSANIYVNHNQLFVCVVMNGACLVVCALCDAGGKQLHFMQLEIVLRLELRILLRCLSHSRQLIHHCSQSILTTSGDSARGVRLCRILSTSPAKISCRRHSTSDGRDFSEPRSSFAMRSNTTWSLAATA